MLVAPAGKTIGRGGDAPGAAAGIVVDVGAGTTGLAVGTAGTAVAVGAGAAGTLVAVAGAAVDVGMAATGLAVGTAGMAVEVAAGGTDGTPAGAVAACGLGRAHAVSSTTSTRMAMVRDFMFASSCPDYTRRRRASQHKGMAWARFIFMVT